MLIYILVKYFDVVLQTFSALGKNDMLGSDLAYILKTEAQLNWVSYLAPAELISLKICSFHIHDNGKPKVKERARKLDNASSCQI